MPPPRWTFGPSCGRRFARRRSAPWMVRREPGHRARAGGAGRRAPGRAAALGADRRAAEPAPLCSAFVAAPGARQRAARARRARPRGTRPGDGARDRGGVRLGRGGRALARIRARPWTPAGARLRAHARGVLRDPQRDLVSVAHALIRPRPGVEDRVRVPPRLLPDLPVGVVGDTAGESPSGDGGPLHGGRLLDGVPEGHAPVDAGDADGRAAGGARPLGGGRARGGDARRPLRPRLPAELYLRPPDDPRVRRAGGAGGGRRAGPGRSRGARRGAGTPMERVRIVAAQAATLAALVVGWDLTLRLGWADPLFVPAPIAVAGALGATVAEAWPRLGDTLLKAAAASVIAVGLGVTAGLALGGGRSLYRVAMPYMVALYGIPKILVLPWIALVLGLGAGTAVATGALFAVFPVLLMVAAGVRDVDPTLVTVAVSMGATRRQVAAKVLLPAVLPSVLAGVRGGGLFRLVGGPR